MNSWITLLNGDPNVGMYVVASDEYVIASNELSINALRNIEKVLGARPVRLSVSGVGVIGALIASTSKGLIVPSIISEEEEKVLYRNDIPFIKVDTRYTALGNNLLIGRKGGVASPLIEDRVIDMIRDEYGFSLVKKRVAGLNTPGSLGVVSNGRALIGRIVSEKELLELRRVLGVEITTGSLNMGSSFIRSGIVVNRYGYIVSKYSGGAEIAIADQAFTQNL